MQHSPAEHLVTTSSTYSTLPELAKCELPEVVLDPDGNLPEVLATYELSSEPVDKEKINEQSWHQWMRLPRRKRSWAFIVVILLVLAGVLIGIVVSIVGRQDVQTRAQTEEEKTTSSTSIALPPATVPSDAFGTPTSFPSPPVDTLPNSVCRGTVCPQMFTSARLTTSPSNISTTYLFARGRDNAIWYRAINESKLSWISEWQTLGGTFSSQPAATSCDDGRIDVFAVWSGEKSTRVKTFQNGVWSNEWATIYGNSASAPVVCSLRKNNMNIVAIQKDDHSVRQKWQDDGRTYGPISLEEEWSNIGGKFSSVSAPDIGCAEVIEGALVRFDMVAYRKVDRGFGMFFRQYNSTPAAWDDAWTPGEGEYRGDPTVVSTLDGAQYFGIGVDMAVWITKWTYSDGYAPALSIRGKFQSVVSALATKSSSSSTSRMDVLAVGTDARLKHKAWIGGTWGTEWEDLGGYFDSSPKAVRLGDGIVVVFGIGPNGIVIHATFEIGTGYIWGLGEWYADGGQISTEWYRDGLAS